MQINNVKYKVISFIGCAFVCMYIISSCGVSKDFQISTSDTSRLAERGYTANMKDLEEGYKMYVSRCGNCHNLIVPSKYTISEWQLTHINKEFERAKVEKSDEKRLISMFIYSKAR